MFKKSFTFANNLLSFGKFFVNVRKTGNKKQNKHFYCNKSILCAFIVLFVYRNQQKQ